MFKAVPSPGLRRRALAPLLGLAAGGLSAFPRPARAQAASWPDHPVRLVVPFGPGGAADSLARLLAPAFPARANGQPLVVENRSGAGGTIGGANVAGSRPDGYSLLVADMGPNAVGHELIPTLSFDPRRAFTPIVHLANLPLVLIVRRDLEAADLSAFLALAKARREPLTYASPSVGHPTHLADELMGNMAGVRFTPVHYRSGSDVLRSLVQKETDFAVISVSTALPFIRENSVRPLGVGDAAPVAALPGVPPIASVLPGFQATTWHGIAGPAGMAPELVARINAVFNAILAVPEVRDALVRVQAAEVVGGTPDAFGRFMAGETARWTPVIRAAGIRAE